MWWPGGMTFRWARGSKGGGANGSPPGDLRLILNELSPVDYPTPSSFQGFVDNENQDHQAI